MYYVFYKLIYEFKMFKFLFKKKSPNFSECSGIQRIYSRVLNSHHERLFSDSGSVSGTHSAYCYLSPVLDSTHDTKLALLLCSPQCSLEPFGLIHWIFNTISLQNSIKCKLKFSTACKTLLLMRTLAKLSQINLWGLEIH